MDMIEKVKEFLNDLVASLQRARLYSDHHQIFLGSIDKAFDCLQEILKEKGELIIGVVSQELAFEKEIFFELSSFDLTKKVIVFFQEKGIEKIIFYPHVSKGELRDFVAFLVNPVKEQIKMDLGEYLTTLGIRNIAVGKMQPPDETKPDKPIDFHGIYEDYLRMFYQCVHELSENKPPDFSGLRISAGRIIEHLALRSQDILKVAQGQRQAAAFFAHSVNVSILAMYFAFKLGFSRSNVADTGIAAIFHDIGRIYKDAKNHSRRGAGVLLRYVEPLGALPALVSFEHHLRFDLKEYPGLPVAHKPCVVSLVVSICDIYSALIAKMNAKRYYTPEAIYNLMTKGRGRVFDPDLLNIFFRIIGVWPVGTIVLLSDSSVAVVRQENEEEIFSPKVEVIYPAEKRKLIDLKEKKDALKIQRALDPSLEGKAYIHLV